MLLCVHFLTSVLPNSALQPFWCFTGASLCSWECWRPDVLTRCHRCQCRCPMSCQHHHILRWTLLDKTVGKQPVHTPAAYWDLPVFRWNSFAIYSTSPLVAEYVPFQLLFMPCQAVSSNDISDWSTNAVCFLRQFFSKQLIQIFDNPEDLSIIVAHQ